MKKVSMQEVGSVKPGHRISYLMKVNVLIIETIGWYCCSVFCIHFLLFEFAFISFYSISLIFYFITFKRCVEYLTHKSYLPVYSLKSDWRSLYHIFWLASYLPQVCSFLIIMRVEVAVKNEKCKKHSYHHNSPPSMWFLARVKSELRQEINLVRIFYTSLHWNIFIL